ncbi:MAG: stringent starvation protein A [Gammaproteobacteria bacterium]|nr:stringent starvation protein A [Gammaproteobacteria bacterium]
MAQLANRRSQMTFYSDATGVASHAVRFVLAEKAINVEINNIAPGDEHPEELNDLNPYNGILTLVDRDLVLYEEQIIMEYLDERFPHPPLLPVDPVSRAANRLFRYRIKRDIYSVVERLQSGTADKKELAESRKMLRDDLTAISPVFIQKPYFMSTEFSLVDSYLAPVLWRLPLFGVDLPPQADPLLKYADRIFARDSFQSGLTELEDEMR